MVSILISGLQFLTANESFSQGFKGETVTLDVKNTNIREVFAMVESQTGFRFAYNPDIIRSYKVSIEHNSIDLKELLDVIFQGTSMRYEVVNNKILVYNNIKRPAVRTAPRIIRNDIFETLQYRRPVRNVTGTVQDVNGAPLIGVNILVKGTNTGTTTDVEGRFSLNDVDDQAILVLSYIGYESLEVPIEGRSSLIIIMQEDVTTLDEVDDARLQFLHEDDLVRAIVQSTVGTGEGIVNVAGDGVITLSQAVALVGRPSVPVIAPAAGMVGGLFKRFGLADYSPDQMSLLSFGRGVDTTRMRELFGFEPEYTTREAFESFAEAVRDSGGQLTGRSA